MILVLPIAAAPRDYLVICTEPSASTLGDPLSLSPADIGNRPIVANGAALSHINRLGKFRTVTSGNGEFNRTSTRELLALGNCNFRN